MKRLIVILGIVLTASGLVATGAEDPLGGPRFEIGPILERGLRLRGS